MVTVARMRYQRHIGRREVVALGRRACAGARRSIRVRQRQARLLNHLGWFRMSRTTCWPDARRCPAVGVARRRDGSHARDHPRGRCGDDPRAPDRLAHVKEALPRAGVCVGISRYRRKISREILKSRTFLGQRRFARKNKANASRSHACVSTLRGRGQGRPVVASRPP